MFTISEAKFDDAQKIASLAKAIWEDHYTDIIGAEQVAWMLRNFQSEAAIQEQITSDLRYYLVQSYGEYAGYFAVQNNDRHLFISKFYLKRGFRGKGLARKMLQYIEDLAIESGLRRLQLTVNKENPAIAAYLALGFTVGEPLVTDIGGGFVMDDYVMEKVLH